VEGAFLDQKVLSGATSLLVMLSGATACRRLLASPEWTGPLLRLFFLGPAAVQRRAGRVLRSVLPGMAPEACDVDFAALGGDGTAAPLDGPGAAPLVRILLDVAAAAAVPGSALVILPPGFAAVLASPDRRAQTLSEAMAMLRVLADAPRWRAVVVDALTQAIDAGRTFGTGDRDPVEEAALLAAGRCGPAPTPADTGGSVTDEEASAVSDAASLFFGPATAAAAAEARASLADRARAVAALGVVGGFPERLRAGGPCLVEASAAAAGAGGGGRKGFGGGGLLDGGRMARMRRSGSDDGDEDAADGDAPLRGWVAEMPAPAKPGSGPGTVRVVIPPADDAPPGTQPRTLLVRASAVTPLPLVPPAVSTCAASLASAVMSSAVMAASQDEGDAARYGLKAASARAAAIRDTASGSYGASCGAGGALWSAAKSPTAVVSDGGSSVKANGQDAGAVVDVPLARTGEEAWEWVVSVSGGSGSVRAAVGLIALTDIGPPRAPDSYTDTACTVARSAENDAHDRGSEVTSLPPGKIGHGSALRFVYDGRDGSLRVWKWQRDDAGGKAAPATKSRKGGKRRSAKPTGGSDDVQSPPDIAAAPTPQQERDEAWGDEQGTLLCRGRSGASLRFGAVLLGSNYSLRSVRLRRIDPQGMPGGAAVAAEAAPEAEEADEPSRTPREAREARAARRAARMDRLRDEARRLRSVWSASMAAAAAAGMPGDSGYSRAVASAVSALAAKGATLDRAVDAVLAASALRALSRVLLVPGAAAQFLAAEDEADPSAPPGLRARQALMRRSLRLSPTGRGLADAAALDESVAGLASAADLATRAAALTAFARSADASLPPCPPGVAASEASLREVAAGGPVSRAASDESEADAADDGPAINRLPWRDAGPAPRGAPARAAAEPFGGGLPSRVPGSLGGSFAGMPDDAADPFGTMPAPPAPVAAPRAAAAGPVVEAITAMGFSEAMAHVAMRHAPNPSPEAVANWLIMNHEQVEAEVAAEEEAEAEAEAAAEAAAAEAAVAAAEAAAAAAEAGPEAEAEAAAATAALEAEEAEAALLDAQQDAEAKEEDDGFGDDGGADLADDLEVEDEDGGQGGPLDAASRYFPDIRDCAAEGRSSRRSRRDDGGRAPKSGSAGDGSSAAATPAALVRARRDARQAILGRQATSAGLVAELVAQADTGGADASASRLLSAATAAATVHARRCLLLLILQWRAAAPLAPGAAGRPRLSVASLLGDFELAGEDAAVLRTLLGDTSAARRLYVAHASGILPDASAPLTVGAAVAASASSGARPAGPPRPPSSGHASPDFSVAAFAADGDRARALLGGVSGVTAAEALAVLLRLELTRGAVVDWGSDVDLTLAGAADRPSRRATSAGGSALTSLAAVGLGLGTAPSSGAGGSRGDSFSGADRPSGAATSAALLQASAGLFRLPSSSASGLGSASASLALVSGPGSANGPASGLAAALSPGDDASLGAVLRPELSAALTAPGGGNELSSVLAGMVADQLAQAALRRHRSASWSADKAIAMSDTQVASAPSLSFVRWLTTLLLDAASPRGSRGMRGEVPLATAQAAEAVGRGLFRAWAIALRSASVAFKEQAMLQLGDIIERTRALALRSPGLVPRWADLLAVVPADRIEALAARHLDSELESSPRSSRYLQSLIEFASLLRFMRDAGEGDARAASSPGAADGTAAAAAAASAASAGPMLAASPSDGASDGSRHFLRLLGGASRLTIDGTATGSTSRKQWTVEMWVRRSGDAGELAADQAADGRDPAAPLGGSSGSGSLPSYLDCPSTAPAPFPTVSMDKAGRSGGARSEGRPSAAPSLSARSAAGAADEATETGVDFDDEATARLLRAAIAGDTGPVSTTAGRGKRRFQLGPVRRPRPGADAADAPPRILANGDPAAEGVCLLLECGADAPDRYRHAVGIATHDRKAVAFEYEAPPGVWVHLAFVCEESGSVALLVNGEQAGDAEPLRGNTNPPVAGLGDARSAATADLLEVRFWRAARSTAQVRRDLARPLGLPRAGSLLCGHWLMREGRGSYAEDTTGVYDRCYGEGIAWGSEPSPPLPLPRDEHMAEARAQAEAARLAGDHVTAAAAEAQASLQGEARSGLVSALGQAPGSSWRSHAGRLEREGTPGLPRGWGDQQKLAMHLEVRPAGVGASWRDAALDFSAATAIREALEAGEDVPLAAAERLDPECRAHPGRGGDPTARGSSNDAAGVAADPVANSVWVEGTMELPETLLRCRVVGRVALSAFPPGLAPGAGGDAIAAHVGAACERDPVSAALNGDLDLVVSAVEEGDPAAAPYVLGMRLVGTVRGEDIEGTWSAVVRSAPDMPPPVGAMRFWAAASPGVRSAAGGVALHADSDSSWRGVVASWTVPELFLETEAEAAAAGEALVAAAAAAAGDGSEAEAAACAAAEAVVLRIEADPSLLAPSAPASDEDPVEAAIRAHPEMRRLVPHCASNGLSVPDVAVNRIRETTGADPDVIRRVVIELARTLRAADLPGGTASGVPRGRRSSTAARAHAWAAGTAALRRRTGLVMFQVRVLSDGGSVVVGLAAAGSELATRPGTEDGTVSFGGSGCVTVSGSDSSHPGAALSAGDIAGVLIDYESNPDGRISFFVNGHEAAAAGRTVKDIFGDRPFAPVVGLKSEGASARCVGLRRGGVRVVLASGRPDRHRSLAVRFVDGIPHGMGRLELARPEAPAPGAEPALPFAAMLAGAEPGAEAAEPAAAAASAPTAAPAGSAVPADAMALVGPWVRGSRLGVFEEEREAGPSTFGLYRGCSRVRDATEEEFLRGKEVFGRAEAARVARLKELAGAAAEAAMRDGELLSGPTDAVRPGPSAGRSSFSVGDLVRVIPGITPSTGWGAAGPDSVGPITTMSGNSCTIGFPEQAGWNGRINELEHADGRDDTPADDFPVGPASGHAAVASLARLSSSPEAVRSRERRVVTKGSFSVNRGQFFVLMPSLCPRSLSIDSRLTEVEVKRSDQAMAIGSRGFTRGVHYWEVHMDLRHENLMFEAHNRLMFIGVADRWGRFDAGQWRDYGWVNYMALNSSSEGERLFGQHFEPNDHIGVLLDMDHGVVSFMRDGRPFGEYKFADWGPAYTRVRSGANGGPVSRALFPVIGMSSGASPITIRRQKWVSLPGGRPKANLSAVLEAATLLQRWDRPGGRTVELPASIEAEAQARFGAAESRPNVVVARVRGGVRAPFDRSSAACTAVLAAQKSSLAGSLRGGDRIKFWGKEAEVVGAYRGRLWYRVDGEDAWYLEGTELDEGIGDGHSAVLPRPDAVRAEAEAEEAAAAGDAPAAEAVSQAAFRSWLHDPFWTLEADEAVVRLVNAQCDMDGVDPANLLLRRCSDEVRAALGCPEEFTRPDFLRRLRARFAVLLCLNWRLESLLPVVDLTVRRRSGLVATADPSRLTFASALGRRVAALRGLCFTRAKRTFLDRVLQVTSKSTRPAGESGVKPSSVPELPIRRLDANPTNLWAIASLDRRRRRSVMGQLHAQTSDWADSAFRRDFAWVADQGQQRNFFVKMVNERADDAGGPYRAIVEAAAAIEPAGPLGLFGPCPNAVEQEHGGANREIMVIRTDPSAPLGVIPLPRPTADAPAAGAAAASAAAATSAAAPGAADSTSLDAATAASLPSDLVKDMAAPADAPPSDPEARLRLGEYRFAGLLAGTAVRHDILMDVDLPPSLWRALAGQALTPQDVFAVDRRLRNAVYDLMQCLPAGVTADHVAERTAAAAAAGHADADDATAMGGTLSDEDVVSMAVEADVGEAASSAALTSLRSLAESACRVAADRNPDAPRAALARAAAAVTFATRTAFARMIVDAVARAGARQLAAWVDGVTGVVPAEVLPLFTPAELQLLFCGSAAVDVDLLKRVAEFPDGLTHADPHVGWLFEVLEEAEQAVRKQFVSFVAARNRMPQSADSFTQSFKVTRLNPRDGADVDRMLPNSATCFFQLKLPPYSSKEVLKERLFTALASSYSMDDN